MKRLSRTFVAVSALSLALVTTATVRALRPELRLDATTPDGQITELTAELLEQGQFAHQPIDNAMATKFLDQYIDSLDGSHELFLQSDIAEFHRFLPDLANATLSQGDTEPAHVIFDRYLQRLGERAAFVTKALATEKFDFSGHDRFLADREKSPAPRDETEAHALWHERLRAEVLQEKLVGKKPDQFVQTLTHRYQRQVEMMKKLSDGSMLELYLNGLAHAYDPHSDYMGREQLESFNIAMNLSLAGIGATLQTEDGICKIMELVPGEPAAASTVLKAGAKIVGVSQGPGKEVVDLVDLPLPQAVDLIRGPKGTDVTLTIIPAGATDDVRKTITIQRDEIHLESQEAKARIVDFPAKDGQTMRLGVIDLPAFYANEDGKGQSATADVAQLVNKLEEQNVRGIILDLRRNGGGSLAEAISLTGLFIPSGPVVQTRDLAGRVKVDFDDDGHALYTGPLIVLTSRFSASASEILAGALQDYGRALIVGDTSTFGKGTVQT
ncbi:MAG: S41 family peptidase, partial [Chthoniobacterales bacterium]